jgi:aminoglycoside phosphotransferase (APT) family kinase protein
VLKADITPAVVGELVREQFPQWADLRVEPVDLDGWDNTTYRLGDDMSVRLPSADIYIPQVDKEHRWLPVLAEHLPLAIPAPLAKGVPGCGFPRPWSVYRWLPGTHARVDRIADLSEFAMTLGDFLAALYAIDGAGGPPAGQHSHFRGDVVTTWDAETRRTIAELVDDIDAEAVAEVWEAAVETRWDGTPVWVHGDVTPSNLLVVDGRLSAVIDFGCSAVGDPACDLTIAWTLFEGDSRRIFRERLGMDDDTWARARGWALWKALITVARAGSEHPERAEVVARRFGWRQSPLAVVDDLVADHRRTGEGGAGGATGPG